MNLRQLLLLYGQHPRVLELSRHLDGKKGPTMLRGLSGAMDALIISALHKVFPRPLLCVLPDKELAEYFHADLLNLLESSHQVLFLPDSYRRPLHFHQPDNNLIVQRTEVLNLLDHQPDKSWILISYPEACAEKVLSKKDLNKNTFELKVGGKFDLDFLMELLAEHDFERTDFVYEAGQFSIRGGIIDVYSYAHELPYRIELNGDQVESIRVFDPQSQLSTKKVDFVSIVPNINQAGNSGEYISLFDYLPDNTEIWIKDTFTAIDLWEGHTRKSKAYYEQLVDTDPAMALLHQPAKKYEEANQFLEHLQHKQVVEFGTRKYFNAGTEFGFDSAPQPGFNKNFVLLKDNLKENQEKGLQNIIFSETGKQIERLYSIFEDLDPSISFFPIYAGLSKGFVDRDLKLACYTEHQIFDRHYATRPKQGFSNNKALTLKELRELRPGDFVVHVDHGIGKFAGLEKVDVGGKMQEAVRLVYRDNDLLYVSVNSLHKISKYVGKEGTVPKVHKLGSEVWEKLKTTTKKKVKDIARDLIQLYAMRKARPGYAFAPDTYLQTELEASFMYEDTPDQAKSTEDVKRDMEMPHPMDRLVCGDVGFGKTEVAIRAAFKAVADSKQVAVLVPTTILAQQHYHTFRDRLHGFPVNIDYINRFKSTAEQKETLKKLAEGKIDIIIGTHRLVSKDVKFKDVGLLIIDEEQKFGVAVKEKLKALRVNIDSLTLTATPIPRTLHFSLMGARDLSIINTPPPNRQGVITELHVFNDELIQRAVNEEINRGGQVFFIHHRIKDIYDIAERIKSLCPNASVGVGHGQMEGEKLENVMMKFVEGDFDVLVATTIVESGLDIPNANTIIINNAHMFGLSDLHQMRGRVGRSNKKAYCYLLSPPLSTLPVDSRRRLSAIEEFSELGSGFNIAMRDLDIRGAGNLLGAEQSGFITEIGYDMYHKILDEAIQELKEEEFKELFESDPQAFSALKPKEFVRDCQVESDLEILIPDSYVRNTAERLSLYNELSNLENSEALDQYREMLIDRFGPLPRQVNELLQLIQLKWYGKELGFEKITLKNGQLNGYFPAQQESAFYQSEQFAKMIQYVQQNAQRCAMKQTPKYLLLTVKSVNQVFSALEELRKMAEWCGIKVEADHVV